jgi:Conserved protein/domain typically associated with flavoprotein oxygenases, DIM6/NTAB family
MRILARFCIIILACLPTISWADDDSEYLAGAVPEQDGKVVFTKEFNLPGADQNTIYEYMYNWLDKRMKANNNTSRIVLTEKEKWQIVASVEDYLVFTDNTISRDRAIMNYNIMVSCGQEKCFMQIDRIKYNYENQKSSSEEMITDNVALNKNKTSIFRGYRKFRVGTIDYVKDMFENARISFFAEDSPLLTQSLQAAKTSQTVTATPVVTTPPQATSTQTVQQTASSTLQGYKQLSPDKIPGNIIKMLNEDWMIITAGTDEKFNMMTAGWGGIGVLYSKPVAICYINPLNYTYQFMETNSTYTFTFYTEAYREALLYCGSNSGRDTDKVKGSGLTPITTPSGSKAFSEAWLIIECRKLVGQSLNHDTLFDEGVKTEWAGKQLPKMYIGEIINVWVK